MNIFLAKSKSLKAFKEALSIHVDRLEKDFPIYQSPWDENNIQVIHHIDEEKDELEMLIEHKRDIVGEDWNQKHNYAWHYSYATEEQKLKYKNYIRAWKLLKR